jgi:hypothetical protein
MSERKLDIKIPKMDYQIISVTVKKDGVATKLGENDLIFMTVRDMVHNEEYEFQKSLTNGISYNEDTKKYEIVINSSDTINMECEKKYGYDIVIYFDGDKPKQQIIGNFILSRKYTLNEVI